MNGSEQPHIMRKMDKGLTVSIVIPCRNEVSYISRVLDSILEQSYPTQLIEVIVVDGMSTDGTIDVLKNYQSRHEYIHYYENEKKVTPNAMNIGIENANGDIIVRMDAHSIYPKNYISRLVEWLIWLDADNVGGALITVPASQSLEAEVVAHAMSHPFGVGNAYFRLGVNNPKRVDTVPFGCYWREVFQKIGNYDEDLVRGQDNELNSRLEKAGGKIYLVPDIKTRYFPRDTLQKAWKMYFQYGYCRPFVNKKLGRVATLRQFVPLLFLVTTSLFLTLSIFNKWFLYLAASELMVYFLTALYVSLRISLQNRKLQMFPLLVITFAGIHISYGWGYFKGLFETYLLGRMPNVTMRDTPLTR